MRKFTSAFNAWLEGHPASSLRQLAAKAEVDGSLLSGVRQDKRAVTFATLTKLLPAIEAASSRKHAITLLVAYLTDETPLAYLPHVRIEPVDADSGEATTDTYSALAGEWEAMARQDPKFHAVWSGLNAYILHPDELEKTIFKDPDEIEEEIKSMAHGPMPPRDAHDLAAKTDSFTHTLPTKGGKVTLFTGMQTPEQKFAEDPVEKAKREKTAQIEREGRQGTNAEKTDEAAG